MLATCLCKKRSDTNVMVCICIYVCFSGVLVMVIGCIVFSLPHFLASDPGNGIGKHSYINDKSGSSPSLSSSSLASQIHVSPLEDGKPKGGRNSMCKIASPQSLHYTSRSGNRSENDSSSLGNTTVALTADIQHFSTSNVSHTHALSFNKFVL